MVTGFDVYSYIAFCTTMILWIATIIYVQTVYYVYVVDNWKYNPIISDM